MSGRESNMTDQVQIADDEQQQTDAAEAAPPETPAEPPPQEQPEPEATDEVVITIGDEPAPVDEEARAPDWVRELRKSHRELQRENRALKQRLDGTPAAEPALGKKPTLEDHDYDTAKYEADLERWYDAKRQHDAKEEAARREAERQQADWQAKLDAYNKSRDALKVSNYDMAEERVLESMSQQQQAILLKVLSNPAAAVYALGTNPAKLKDMASISDPVLFAAAAGKLEDKLKVTQRTAPPPEKTVAGSAPISGSVDSNLERLREEAARTGDFTKVLAYKRQKR